jgi:hypothetical protein
MQKEKRFSVGDTVTYKTNRSYYYGGMAPTKLEQKIVGYGDYNTIKECYAITVTHDGNGYLMLESEFEEYDNVTKEVSNYSIF